MLYGSRARGEARQDSGWDVAIFLKGGPSSEDRDILSDIGFDLMMEHGQHLQTIAIDAGRIVFPQECSEGWLGSVTPEAASRFAKAERSQLISGDGERGRYFGRAFNRAEELRLIADYEDRVVPTAADAARLQATAVEFVAYCRSLL